MSENYIRRIGELNNFRTRVANDHWLKYGGVDIWAPNLKDEEVYILANLNCLAKKMNDKNQLEEFSKVCSDFLSGYIKLVEEF